MTESGGIGSEHPSPPDRDGRADLLSVVFPPMPMNAADKAWQVLAVAIIVAQALVIQFAWSQLPESIPTHFDLYGQPDRWGARAKIWLLPAISFGLTLVCSVVASRFWTHSVPWELTRENAPAVLRLSRRLLLQLPAVINGFILWSVHRTILGAFGRADGVGPWFAPLFIATSLAFVVNFYVRGKRAANRGSSRA